MQTLMLNMIHFLEVFFGGIPLPLMEVWGRLSFVIGGVLAVCAYGGMTFEPAGRWGLGRQRQAWDPQAFMAIGLTLTLVPLAGYTGSNIVLVEGAQTFESLKDAVVLLCVVLFGYPALIAIPAAYMLSDVIEGLPPHFVLSFTAGYIFSSPIFWLGHQAIGRNPDFRKLQTWGRYLIFVAFFMVFYPMMWGYICANQFPPDISYPVIVPALSFTQWISWLIVPFMALGLFPLTRKFGLFWADIPGHVKQRLLGQREWIWESGRGRLAQASEATATAEMRGVPIRVALAGAFLFMVLILVGSVAFLSLRSGQEAATEMASRLHQEISENINLRLDDYLAHSQMRDDAERIGDIDRLLASSTVAKGGRALLIDRAGKLIATSLPGADTDVATNTAIANLKEKFATLSLVGKETQYRFDVVTAEPLSRETWLAQATPYSDNSGRFDWIVLTAMPESYYLASIQAGNGETAILSTLALTAALVLAAVLAGLMAAPLRRITSSAEAMARGDLTQRVTGSRLLELNGMVGSFNRMAEQLQESFFRTTSSEQTQKAIFNASPTAMAVFDSSEFASHGTELARGFPIIDVNQAWEKITGHPRDTIVGGPTTNLKLWDRPTDRRGFLELMMKEGRVDDFEAPLLRADGSPFYGSLSIRNATVGNGRLSILAVEDITERTEAAAKLVELNRRLQALFDAAIEVAVIATDSHGDVTVFNRGAERMLGYSESEVLGQSALQFFSGGEIEACAGALAGETGRPVTKVNLFAELTRDGASNVRNWTFLRRDGVALKVSLALSAVRNDKDELAGFLGLARDITAQLAAEHDLIELNQQLDLRVRDRTQALQTSTERLQATLDNLRQTQDKLIQSEKLASLGSIVAVVAHELNTPIGVGVTVASTMMGRTETLQRHVTSGTLRRSLLDEHINTQQEGMQLLLQALNRAHELVSNFKRVAVDQGSAQRRTFSLKQAVNDIASLTRASLRKAPYSLLVNIPDDLAMDSFPGAIEQVMTNLFNNSIAHGFSGRDHGVVSVSAKTEGEQVEITYSDDGNGMSADVIRRIFDPFFTTALGKGGSGLGMAICYNLVTGPLGGNIEVTSEPGHGSRFVITLPRSAPEGRTAAAPLMAEA